MSKKREEKKEKKKKKKDFLCEITEAHFRLDRKMRCNRSLGARRSGVDSEKCVAYVESPSR